ncbi:hypothetical protein OROGR_003760 [Orobanche gracilis]
MFTKSMSAYIAWKREKCEGGENTRDGEITIEGETDKAGDGEITIEGETDKAGDGEITIEGETNKAGDEAEREIEEGGEGQSDELPDDRIQYRFNIVSQLNTHYRQLHSKEKEVPATPQLLPR